MDRVLLDTQVFLIAVTEGLERVSRKARTILQDATIDRCLSAVSLTEIAIKQSIGKLQISRADVSAATADLQMTVMPFTSRHALEMFDLPLHHREPFDRMIIAVALAEQLPLVSGDREFRKYRRLNLLW